MSRLWLQHWVLFLTRFTTAMVALPVTELEAFHTRFLSYAWLLRGQFKVFKVKLTDVSQMFVSKAT